MINIPNIVLITISLCLTRFACGHMRPYGCFEIDRDSRLPID
jgi:hypothetical protein